MHRDKGHHKYVVQNIIFRPSKNHEFRPKFRQKFQIFVQISSSYWKAFNLQTDKYSVSTDFQVCKTKCSISLYYGYGRRVLLKS